MATDSVSLSSDFVETYQKKTCPLHEGKYLEFFCADHVFFGCSVCFYKEHKACKNVQLIEEASMDIQIRSDYKRFMDELETLAFMVKCVNCKITRCKSLAMARRDCLLRDIKNAKAELIQSLHTAEKEIEDEIERKQKEEMQRFENASEECTSVSVGIEALRVQMDRFKTTDENLNMFIELKEGERNVKNMRDLLEKQCTEGTKVAKYVLRRKDPPQNILESKTEHWFGTLVEMDTRAAKVTIESAVDVRAEGDQETCNIIEAIALEEDGNFAVLDSSNKKVKLINADKRAVVSQLTVSNDSAPFGITKSTNSRIAVTVPKERKIVILSTIDNALTVKENVMTPYECFSIGSVLDNFVVSVNSPERLDILDKQGNCLKTVSVDKEYHELFNDISNITVSPDCGTVYVSDQTKSMVISVSLWSNKTTTYSDWLFQPLSLAVDQSGILYISKSTSNILQTTADLRWIRYLLTKLSDFRKTQAIAYCDITDRIIRGFKSSDQMEVIKLSP